MGAKPKKVVPEPIREPDEIRVRKFKQEMLSVRLDEPTLDWLKEVAERKGLGVSSLARMLILEGLSKTGPRKSGPWV